MFGRNKKPEPKVEAQPRRKLEATEAASKATNADKVAKPNEKKGKDNNKRLAQLEGKELAREYPRAFELGQQAKAACIPEDQMPVLNDKEREAYLLGAMAELVRIEPALFRADEAWFVYDDGRQYLRKREPASPVARSSLGFPMIARDTIEPTRGADGKMHDSMSSYRRSLEPSGNPQGERYIEIGNESIKTVTRDFDRKQRRDDIRAGLEDVRNGRVPPLTVLED